MSLVVVRADSSTMLTWRSSPRRRHRPAARSQVFDGFDSRILWQNVLAPARAGPRRRQKRRPRSQVFDGFDGRILWQNVLAPVRAGPRRRAKVPQRSQAIVRFLAVAHPARFYVTCIGQFRVFNDAEYRFYRSTTGPPEEGDTPFATSSSLPDTPSDTFGDDVWYLACSYFNGVLDSGFLPLTADGRRYYRLEIDSDEEVGNPPNGPGSVRLEVRAGGVIRVHAVYYQSGSDRATQWAITYTTDGSTPGTPPAVSPDVTVTMPTAGLAVLAYDLPGQSHGTTVKVRVQTRRSDGSWLYSEGSSVETATADAEGPSTPLFGDRWPGRVPEDF